MNEKLIADFKQKLTSCGVFGPFMKTIDPAFVETAGYAGCDFAVLDMEHGPISIENMQNNIRAAQIAGILPIVRVPAISEEAISKPLDIGAAGVQIPQITNAAQAREAVRISKYHPVGERGVCRFVRASGYSSTPREKYFKTANNILVILQLEGQEAIKNLDEILDVPDVDIIFIGPYDLSQSLGVPGQTSHPSVISEMEKIVTKAKEKGVVTGTFTDSAQTLEMWTNAGVKYISYSVDVGIFYEACRDLKDNFKKLTE